MNELTEQKTERLQQLKQRAQELVQQQELQLDAREIIPLEVAKLLEDLRIYQVELELQNEELRAAQRDAELAQRRYQSLFEQMPLPALVVQANGQVENGNERADLLLGARISYAGPDNRLFQRLNRDDRTRLHVALRDLRPGDPLVSTSAWVSRW